MLAIWSLVPLPFRKPAWTSGSSRFTYCWSLAWRILSVTLLACEMSAIVWYFEHSLSLPFFGIGMKTDLFQSCGHCSVFQIFWHIECSTFTASSKCLTLSQPHLEELYLLGWEISFFRSFGLSLYVGIWTKSTRSQQEVFNDSPEFIYSFNSHWIYYCFEAKNILSVVSSQVYFNFPLSFN